MKPILLLYLKNFFFFSILFGLAMLLIDLIIDHAFSWKFLRNGFNFGLLMSLFFVTIHIISVLLSGEKNLTSENLGVRHKRSILSGNSQENLINKLKSDPEFEEMKITNEKDGIKIETGLSFQSWGETISIHVKSLTPTSNEFEITSEPKMKWTQVDYGKNLDNVNKVVEVLAKIS